MSAIWKEGFFKFTINGHVVKTLVIDGDEGKEDNDVVWIKLKSRKFEDPVKIGNDVCNVEIFYALANTTGYGVVTEDGEKIMLDNGGVLDWMDEEAMNKIINDKDPAENPPNNYDPKPDQVGKILWLCGSTGMGKTTTAKILQEKEGFVNYEGDCFMFGMNPYVGAAPEGSSHFGTRALSGIPQERLDVCRKTLTYGYTKLLKGEKVEVDIWEDFYNLFCEDILKERKKLGGRWVVNQAVYTRTARDIIRNRMGDDLILIVLESGEDDLQIDRLARRALGEEEVTEEALDESKKKMEAFSGYHETVEDDEPNTFKIVVTKDMNPKDVARIALEKFETYC